MGEINSENIRCGTYGNVSDHDRKILEDLRKEFEEGDTSATVAIGVIDDLLGPVGEGPQVEQDASKGGNKGQQAWDEDKIVTKQRFSISFVLVTDCKERVTWQDVERWFWDQMDGCDMGQPELLDVRE